MSTYFFKIPYAKIEAANALAVKICGLPVFDETRTRGVDRASAYAYAHGVIGTLSENEEYARKIADVGGEAISTDRRQRRRVDPGEVMAQLGEPRRPDLEKLTVAQIKAALVAYGRSSKAKTKAALIDEMERSHDPATEIEVKREVKK